MRALIIWKVLLIGFHFDIRANKVLDIFLKFFQSQFILTLNIKHVENKQLAGSSVLF